MKNLEELELINELRMYYKTEVFDKISGKSTSSLTTPEKQKYLFDSLFNDRKTAYTIASIKTVLDNDTENDAFSIDLASITDSSTTDETNSSVFEMSTLYGEQISNTPTFGNIAWEWPSEDFSSNNEDYLKTLLTTSSGSSPVPAGKNIALFKMKSSLINPGTTSTEASEVFMNYIPTIERSRCTPFLKVDVFTRGAFYEKSGSSATSPTEVADDFTISNSSGETFASYVEAVPNVLSLRFLNDNEKIGKDKFNTADGAMAKATTTLHGGTTTTTQQADDDEKTVVKAPYSIQRNGMEMFTMPQSLISKKRWANIDPFRPFMTIKKATVKTQSAGQGIISWNTAELVLEIYDRHRLNDISYLLDPSQYAFTKFELAIGWKHQDAGSSYGKYINRLVSKELYSLRSSSYSFNDAGVVTVNLKLAMNGAREISNSSMFSADSEGQGIRDAYSELTRSLQAIRAGTSAINSQRTSGTLLPVSVITQAGNSSAMTLNTTTLNQITAASRQGEMSDEQRREFTEALNRLGAGQLTDYYTMLNEYIDKFVKEVGINNVVSVSTGRLPGDNTYEYLYTENNEWKTRAAGTSGDWISLAGNEEAIDRLNVELLPLLELQNASLESGDSIRFDKLFINALAKRLLTGDESSIDEIHIFMYRFNEKCPGMSNKYMGDFLLNKDSISERLIKIIRETQNLTISGFISAVKSEMKDKLNISFNIVTSENVETINSIQDVIDTKNDELNEQQTLKNDKTEEFNATSSTTRQTTIQSDIDIIDEKIKELIDTISEKQREIDEILDSGEDAQRLGLKAAQVVMPDLKIKVEVKKTNDGKDVLRLHVYDGNSKPNELSEFLSNLNNSPTLEMSEISSLNRETVSSSASSGGEYDNSREERIKAELIDNGLATVRTTTSRDGTVRRHLVVNTQSHIIKDVIKSITPSITYGVEGTAINKASMSMLPDDNVQANFLLQTQNDNTANAPNSQTSSSERDAQRIMPVNIQLDMMGCPLLTYGQEYFVDFDTNTDLDNVYAMTAITHSVSPGAFTTSVELKPTFRGSVSFSELLADINFLTPEESQNTTDSSNSPTTEAAE